MEGGKSAIGAVAVVFIGAVVCSAASVAGDNLQDLKAGQLVGATPWRQQVMLGVGVIASASVMAPVMNVLQFAYGIGEPSHAGVKALPAPQANLVRSVAEGMFGGTLPGLMIAIGAVIGVLIIITDLYLKRIGSRWSAPVLAVAVGIYLPLDVSLRRHTADWSRNSSLVGIASVTKPTITRSSPRTACCSRRD